MSQDLNQARPYAIAIFELASEQKSLTAWLDTISILAFIATNPSVISLANNPRSPKEKLFNLFKNTLKKNTESVVLEQALRLLNFLIIKRRLQLLPSIYAALDNLRCKKENLKKGSVISAKPLSEKQQEKLENVLVKRLKAKVFLDYAVDPNLLGGMILRFGNDVIDSSLQNKLQRLANSF
ncbi:MAG: F0F1 ATP synthase subunit delta [Gammaproteobacteria bacterium]